MNAPDLVVQSIEIVFVLLPIFEVSATGGKLNQRNRKIVILRDDAHLMALFWKPNTGWVIYTLTGIAESIRTRRNGTLRNGNNLA